jgi:predicted permease
MTGLALDLRFALRLFVTRPAYTIAVVGTLAITIGANIAIFMLVDGVLLRGIPAPRPEQLVAIEERHGAGRLNLTGATVADLVAGAHSFDAIAAYRLYTPGLSTGSHPEQVLAADVSPGYFEVLGTRPALGRPFESHDFASGARRTVILSDGTWRRTFGADPGAVGRVVLVNAEPAEVIGVMPAGLYAPGRPSIWRPRPEEAALTLNRRAHLFTVLGRLRDGRTIEGARSELDLLSNRVLEASGNLDPDMRLSATPLQERLVESVRPALLTLWAAVGLVLLIAAANIANLQLMQGALRDRELAIRRALGAGRTRLLRQLLAECLLLGGVGGTAGILLGLWSAPALASALSPTLPGVAELTPGLRVAVFSGLLSVLTVAAFAIGPALRASNRAGSLRDRSGTAGSSRLRAALVACEVAMTVVLLTGAGLLARSFTTLLRIDPGFDPEGVVTFDVTLPAARYPDAAAHADFHSRLLERIAAMPGVLSAATTGALPMTGTPATTMVPEGKTEADDLQADVVTVSPDLFTTLRMPLLQGREFSPLDRRGSAPVVIVNESAARQFWPDAPSPLGRRLVMHDWGSPYEAEVVGVVGDVRQMGLDQSTRPAAYYPIAQFPETLLREAVVIRASGAVEPVVTAARTAVAGVDPDQPVASMRLLTDVLASAVAQRRFNVVLVSAFAAAASVLAGLGIYGVVAFAVAQRTREIGVRVALGARTAHIVRLAGRVAAIPLAVGLTAGMAAAQAASASIQSLLFDVRSTDPVTLAAVAVAVAVLGGLACLAPMRRALRVDPAVALRIE